MSLEIFAWLGFIAFVLAMLALDLFVLHKDAHAVSLREAALWSAFWIALGLSFGVVIWMTQDGTAAGEYLAGYLIEKSLSVDNVFVFVLIFSYFSVPAMYQHRVLFWGILGALVLRGVFILAGAALLDAFHWILYLFGAFLVYTGIQMFRHQDLDIDPGENRVLRLLKRFVPLTTEYHGQKLFTRQAGVLMATPLFAVLVVVETTDLIFAVDSIPAIFAVTRDPFLVFTSNVFAILGLRALYFLLAGVANRFVYLKIGLAAILVFVGVKMLMTDIYHFPIWASLAVIGSILTASILFSLRAQPSTEIEVAIPDAFGLLTDRRQESSAGSRGERD
jgi:tellurite resistance protein TerC